MSIWKSPIFYIGILLLVVLSAALAAPFVVNWNAYRDNLELYGLKLTGRDVAINGDISARLFPWPRLVLNDVTVANPQGFVGAPIVDANKITMQLNLAGLMAGEISVEKITIDHPVVNLWRQAAGKLNWQFKVDQALQDSKLLDQVKLDQIIVNDGELYLQDEVHGFDIGFTQVKTTMSATVLEGPWRILGTARQGEIPLSISFTSRVYKQGEPFSFGVRFEPQDGTLPALIFDGDLLEDNLKGKVLLEPVVTVDGRESLEGTFKPLKLRSNLEANFEHANLKDIQITPADTKDNGTLIHGSASAIFENGVKATVQLDSPRLDLDALAGAQSLRVWRAGGVMAVVNTLMKDFPKTLDLAATLKVDSLSAAGETVENLNLNMAVEQNTIRVKELSANLPGRSRMKFSGVAFPGDIAAQLGGTLAFESNDARQFVGWLWPEGKSNLTKFWTGTRGRFKSQSNVDWSGQHFLLQDLNYELDGAAGNATLAVQLGALAAVDLKLNAKLLDLDNYMQGGVTNFAQGAGLVAALQGDGALEKRLSMRTDVLRMNGVEAQNVALEFDSSLSGFNIKTFEIGSVEGAALRGQGLVLQSPDGPSGDLKAKLTANDPRGFLRLIGVTGKGADPKWTEVLGVTDMDAVLSFRPGATEPKINYEITGTSGPLQVAASGDVKELTKGVDAGLTLNSEIKVADSSVFARMLGWRLVPNLSDGGKVVMTAAGSNSEGYKSNISVEALAAKFGFDGLIGFGKSLPSLNGKLTVDAADGSPLIKALGVPVLETVASPLQVKANVAPSEGGLSFTDVEGNFLSQNIAGSLELAQDYKINADFNLDQTNLSAVLSAAFMPWQGKVSGIGESFSSAYGPVSGEVWLHPKLLQTDFGADLKEAVLGISFDRNGRQATVAARDSSAEPFNLDISVAPQDGAYLVKGSAHMSLDIARVLKEKGGAVFAQGVAIIDAELKGFGRSPIAAISSFSGDASYVLHDAKLTKISPQNFFPLLDNINSASELQAAFGFLQKGPGINLNSQKLAVTVKNGALVFAPLTLGTPDADLKITSNYDFSTNEFETRADVVAKDAQKIPALQVTYSGTPGELRARSDTAAISDKFGYDFMARDLAELERVQKQQAQIAADEIAQQKADEVKFVEYQAQRNELRLRQREQRVFAAQRVIDGARKKAEWAKLMAYAVAINKTEIRKFTQQVLYVARQKIIRAKFLAEVAAKNKIEILKFEQRVIDAEREKARWVKIMAGAAALTKLEVEKFLRQLPTGN